MPKRKKSTKTRKSAQAHQLPFGFWWQVLAVFSIFISIMLVVSWFNVGGVFFVLLNDVVYFLLGVGKYFLPMALIYVAYEMLKSDNNQVPAVFVFASVLFVIVASALFGLHVDIDGNLTGGIFGNGLNSLLLMVVDPWVGRVLYSLILFFILMFLFKTSPVRVFEHLKMMAPETAKAPRLQNLREKNASSEKKTSASKHSSASKLLSGLVKATKPEEDLDIKKPEDSKIDNVFLDRINSKKSLNVKNLGKKPENKKLEKKEAVPLAPVRVSDENWKFPNLDLFEKGKQNPPPNDIEEKAEIIYNTYKEFDIEVDIQGYNLGPRVTQYTFLPPAGLKLQKITSIESNLALNLGADSLRMEAPIPGKKAVGVEVPNSIPDDVRFRDILESDRWRKCAMKPLPFVVGKDVVGEPVVLNLVETPHILIAGQTGAGKSVMINTLLTSLLYANSPEDLRLILIDPKSVEMEAYEDVPHLLTPIINDGESNALSALRWAVHEMERRYGVLKSVKHKKIDEYNREATKVLKDYHENEVDDPKNSTYIEEGKMAYIVIAIDEMSDLMMSSSHSKEIESLIVRITQKARAVGIHMVLATQRPTVKVITGTIKANVPTRISFSVVSVTDSRTIIDCGGAEKLLGRGDMMYATPSTGRPVRAQGAFLEDSGIRNITNFLREQSEPQYNEQVVNFTQGTSKGGAVAGADEEEDPMFKEALELVIREQKASTSFLQNKLRIGYGRGSRIISTMEERGYIGPQNGSKPREVLISDISEIEQNNVVDIDVE